MDSFGHSYTEAGNYNPEEHKPQINNMTEIQIRQVIGQQEASINKIEPYLTPQEFADYCDSIYTCIAYYRKLEQKVKHKLYPLTPDESIAPGKTDKEG